jgi:hypothetical protein
MAALFAFVATYKRKLIFSVAQNGAARASKRTFDM